MIDLINAAIALLTIVFGLFGFLLPRFTAEALDLAPKGSTMGLSEMRASVGGLFVVTGLVCLWTAAPGAYAMLGVAYSGAALGRMLSILADKPPLKRALVFLVFEAGPAAWLLWANPAPWA